MSQPTLDAVDPATGELIERYPAHDQGEIEASLQVAARAAKPWRDAGFEERGRHLRAVAGLLRERGGELAALMAREMGKPIAQGRAEVEKCAWVCEHYAERAAELLAPRPVATDALDSYVAFQPLGAVLGVMPWNFPLWQVFRFSAPTAMAGNVVLVKHAANVPGCADAIERLHTDAGLPGGVYTNLRVGKDAVASIIERPEVAAVSVTGSRGAGRSVAAAAGGALKKSVLELGGSDAYVVLGDADLDVAARLCAQSRLINAGQSCIAAKRFIVVDAVRDAFTERLVAHMRAAAVGMPLDEATELGPLARVDLRDELHRQVRESVERGARCLLGGEVPDRAGAWYPATVLEGVAPGMPAFDDETFGPVAAIVGARDEDEALRLANQHAYGLGAAVFTADLDRGRALAERGLEAGFCAVNDFVRSDPRLPFGGVKDSGYGRELGEFGIREFVNTKTVYVGR